jgi:hypothetical protein
MSTNPAAFGNGRYGATVCLLAHGPSLASLKGSDRAGRKEITLSGVAWAPKLLG